MLENLWNDWNEGEIHARDDLQFELKSEFLIHARRNVYKQEFFLFIPESLHIDSQSYSREQFYLDETSLIRYKTPLISFKELVNPKNSQSPLICLQALLDPAATPNPKEITDELKLFAAVFKVFLRRRTKELSKQIKNLSNNNPSNYLYEIPMMCGEIKEVCKLFRHIQIQLAVRNNQEEIKRHFRYVDEFISDQINDYLLSLIQTIRQFSPKELDKIDSELCKIVLREKEYRYHHRLGPKTPEKQPHSKEAILHRRSLLNHFVLEALDLPNYRIAIPEKHAPLLGALAAGIAMFFYLTIFAWRTPNFVIDSFPVILFLVLLYILKDRIKEGLKKIYYQQAYRWMPDYSTRITSPKGYKIGRLNESFNFINAEQLPEELANIRNLAFNEELQALTRQESIIQYKREVILYSHPEHAGRRKELTTVFRFNVRNFLPKAHNPVLSNFALDPSTYEIYEDLLPKVYHINLIIRNTFTQMDSTLKTEIKKFRVVVDKIGIKRVEQIN